MSVWFFTNIHFLTTARILFTPPGVAKTKTVPSREVSRNQATGSTPQAEQPVILRQTMVSGDWLGSPIENAVETDANARSVTDARTLKRSNGGILPDTDVRGQHLRCCSTQTLTLVEGLLLALAPRGQTGLARLPLTPQTIGSTDIARGAAAAGYRYPRTGGVVGNRLGLQFDANTLPDESFREYSAIPPPHRPPDAHWKHPAVAGLHDRPSLKVLLQNRNTPNCTYPPSPKPVIPLAERSA